MDTASTSPFISPQALRARIGSPAMPVVFDVRRDVRFEESDRLMPRARRLAPQDVPRFAASHERAEAIVYCVHGLEIGEQAAAELRAAGWDARYLQGGIDGWIEAGGPSVRKRPDLGVDGTRPSHWITRERPRIDRIACPWLVLRFIDPQARFSYVPAADVLSEATRREAVAYDVAGAPIGHEGELCSFDAMLRAFDLHDPALDALARIVRGADTGRMDLSAQSPGLLAVSQGLSILHRGDDPAMLAAALPVYDALYAWCRESV